VSSYDLDSSIRQAAFEQISRLKQSHSYLSREEIGAGFQFGGDRIPFVNPQRGIFKPRQMSYLLSIRTVFPAPGRRVWYDDQREVHRQIFDEWESVEYAFMGSDPDAPDNRWLREAMERRIPIIYFLGIAPGKYEAIVPTYIIEWNPDALKCRIAFGVPDQPVSSFSEAAPERRYALRLVKQRLHQLSFREAVIDAYGGRCAISGLPEPLLLDAAHIIRDSDEQLGQPIVRNGIPLSKVHHAAFDAHLIGIDADSTVHISDRLLSLNDGPMLETLKSLSGGRLRPPLGLVDGPDRDRLALRFEDYRRAN
jgi:putative restriction endonuclease